MTGVQETVELVVVLIMVWLAVALLDIIVVLVSLVVNLLVGLLAFAFEESVEFEIGFFDLVGPKAGLSVELKSGVLL